MFRAVLLGLIFTAQAHAWELTLGPQPVMDRTYYIANEAMCGDVADDIRWAAEVWNFYAGAGFREVQEPGDHYMQVQCQDTRFFEDVILQRGYEGSTYWWYRHGVITDVVMFIDRDQTGARDCLLVHEFGHAMGLAHSDVPGATMHPDSQCQYPTADDLAGAAALFHGAPNCTPYITEGLVVYFPHLDGEWLELRPQDPRRPLKGFYESGRGASVDYGWECALSADIDQIRAGMYFEGKVFDITLQRDGDLWVPVL